MLVACTSGSLEVQSLAKAPQPLQGERCLVFRDGWCDLFLSLALGLQHAGWRQRVREELQNLLLNQGVLDSSGLVQHARLFSRKD